MDLDNLLNTVQQSQLLQELSRVLARGWGHLEIRVEKGQPRWLRPAWEIYNPLTCEAPNLPTGASLADALGAWCDPLAGELARVMGYGYGTIVIGVEHGHVRSILSTTDVRARTGKTGEIGASTTTLHP